ncbi:CynX/NimT family MFS transporter [Stackebrandtia soli]|uniref:CynX/NimT family MFS transporter n=1 Tax=Stackebrandtia soli TaxID=1892856 RepID=UPI0039EA1249
MSVLTDQVLRLRRFTTAAWLVAAGVLLAAFNLRTAVTSVGPLLDEIQSGLNMSGWIAGILTTLPVICFAILGAAIPALVRWCGELRLLLAALVIMTIGTVARALVDTVPLFLVFSGLALAGGAVGNVVIPALVKAHFPRRIGQMTTAYSFAMSVGTMAAAALTIPMRDALGGSWEMALGIWVIPAVFSIIPWFILERNHHNVKRKVDAVTPLRGLGRNRFSWEMMICFGTQSLIAYVMFGWLPKMMGANGYSAAEAGYMLAVFTALGIPISTVVPIIAARMKDQRALLMFMIAGYAVGLPLMWLSTVPYLTWTGIVCVTIGMGTFPLLLTLFGLKTRTAAGTAGLSAFTQSGGYLIAGTGPLLVGVLYDTTDSWTAPYLLLFAAVAAHGYFGWQITKDRYLEDELGITKKVVVPKQLVAASSAPTTD